MIKIKYLIPLILSMLLLTAGYSLFFQKPNEAIRVVTYDCKKDQTAFDLLSSSYKIETKDTDFGKMVTSIEGVTPTEKEFWAFYIDGKSSPVGAEQYKCQNIEKIEWKLEKF